MVTYESRDFAAIIQNTDNYYVIVTRENLSALPYSVEEIYGIRDSGKYGSLKRTYYLKYNKRSLNPAYLNYNISQTILNEMDNIKFEE